MADLGTIPAPACVTRHDYTDVGVRFDCSTVFVGGDPRHWVTTCPAPPVTDPWNPSYFPPPDRVEIELDASGRLAHQLATRAVPPNGERPFEDTVSVYDAAGRLQERTVRDEAGGELWHSIVTQRDAAGRPLAISTTRVPISVEGIVYPQSAQLEETLAYDAIGRLVSQQRRLAATGDLEWNMTVSYDDARLRRDYVIIVDLPYVKGAGGPGHSPFYELLDAEGHVVEFGCEDNCRAADEPPWFVNHVYDEEGRIVTDVYVGAWQGLHRSYVYDCP